MKSVDKGVTMVGLSGKIQGEKDLESMALVLKLKRGQHGSLQKLEFDPSGRHIFCLDCSNNLIALDCKLSKYIQIARLKPVTTWLVCEDCRGVRPTLLVGHQNGQVQVFKMKGAGWECTSVQVNSNAIVALHQNVHRNLYLLADSCNLVLVDSDTLRPKLTLPASGDKYLCAVFSPDNQSFITLTAKGYLTVRNIASAQMLDQLHIGRKPLRKAKFASKKDLPWIVFSDGSQFVSLYNYNLKSFEVYEATGRVLGVQLGSNQVLYLQLEDGSYIRWDCEGREGNLLLRGKESLAGVSVSQSEDIVCTGSRLGQINLYNLSGLIEGSEQKEVLRQVQ